MSGRFRHYSHVVRVASLFVGGFAIFVLLRALLIPPDFGLYGFYRAGALDDVRAQPKQYEGQEACGVCHSPVEELRQQARHAAVACEACHGPAASHVVALQAGDFSVTPTIADVRPLCLRCHTAGAGKPAFLPTVVVADHFPDTECTMCHNPHKPSF